LGFLPQNKGGRGFSTALLFFGIFDLFAAVCFNGYQRLFALFPSFLINSPFSSSVCH